MGIECCCENEGKKKPVNNSSNSIIIDDNKWANNENIENNLLVWKNNELLDNNLNSLCLIFELTNNYENYTNKFSVKQNNQNNQNDKYLLSYKIPSQTIQLNNKDIIQSQLNSMGFKNNDYIYWIKNVFEKDSEYESIIDILKKKNLNNCHIGLLNHNYQQIEKVNEILKNKSLKLFAVKNNFNILNRLTSKKIIDYCKDNKIHFFSYNIFEEGILSGKYNTQNPIPQNMKGAEFYNSQIEKIEKLNGIIKSKNYQDKQIPIIYNIYKGTIPIIDINDNINIQEAIKSVDISLSPEEVVRLERNIDMVDIKLYEEI